MEQSRYGKYQRTKLRRHLRSRVSQGSFEDRNKWYKCWYCGYEFDITKINGNSEFGGEYQLMQTDTSSPDSLSTLTSISTLDTPYNTFISIGPSGITSDDVNKSTYLTHTPIYQAMVSSGCPSCGCGNQP